MARTPIKVAATGRIAVFLIVAGWGFAPHVPQAAELTARGSEPDWKIELSGELLTFSGLDSPPTSMPVVQQPIPARGVEVFVGAEGNHAVTLVAADTICSDTMTGMPYPKAVIATLDGRTLVGCGGEAAAILLGEWNVMAVDGQEIMAGTTSSLGFDPDGSLYGNATCNRFFGTFTLTGEALKTSPAGTTRMACEEIWMDQEARFLAALESVTRFDAVNQGTVTLLDQNGRAMIELKRPPQ